MFNYNSDLTGFLKPVRSKQTVKFATWLIQTEVLQYDGPIFFVLKTKSSPLAPMEVEILYLEPVF
ncbi:hypothetical protein FPG59_05035 [Flavobacterium sp. FPG59]|nr:hypothetical protein FPG59_05035 [Flavobacterium sp. FPG59]